VYLARENGEREIDLVKRLGKSRWVVKDAYKAARKKIKADWDPATGKEVTREALAQVRAKTQFKTGDRPHNALDVTHPEEAAEVMMEASIPEEARGAISDLARSLDISYAAANALQKRMDGRYIDLKRTIGSTKITELRDLAGHNAFHLMGEIARRFAEDPDSIRGEKIRDIAVAAGIMADKHMTLDGKPVQILSVEHRANLQDLIPELYALAKKRGELPVNNPESGRTDILEAEFEVES